MELAVSEMRLSIPERRKNNPIVGAVALLSDGTVLKAHRAYRRNGEHAEESLFERVAERDTDFTASQLFVTLEPCSPGSRGVREIPCAVRTQQARVKEVWIGIQDPWPTVNGAGTAYLVREGLSVHPFDYDLQQQIEAENADWLADAKSKAQKAARADDGDVLTRVFLAADTDDLDPKALGYIKRRLKISAAIGTADFRKALWDEGMLDGWRADAHPTGFGIITLARNPGRFLGQAGLNAKLLPSEGGEVLKRFDEPAVLIPDLVERWLKEIFPDLDSRDQMERRTVERLPFKAIREAILNGLVHRRWDLGAKCFLTVNDRDATIEVKSPGGPVEPVTLEDLKRLEAAVWGAQPEVRLSLQPAEPGRGAEPRDADLPRPPRRRLSAAVLLL